MFRETSGARRHRSSPAASCPGTYEVAAELQGFKKFDRRDLRLEVGKTVDHRRRRWRSGAVEETVNVTAESPLVDVTSKEIGGNITSETLVQLPSVNGNFIGFVGLLPGHRAVDQHRVVRQRLRSASTARIRATTTTCSTAATTTTT